MENPLVSVIIPTYSRPDNIVRAIDSVLAQTYKNIEIIVVDDNGIGTPNQLETEKVLKGYIAEGKINYLKHEVNKNGSAARNTGFRASHGEYVNFLDDDDTFMPENIQKKVDILIDTPENVGGSFSPVCYKKYDWKGKKKELSCIYKKEGNVLEDFLIGKACFNTSAMVFKRSAISELKGFDESFKRHQDFELMIRFFRHYTLKLASPTPLYYMDSTSGGSHCDVITNRLKFEKDFLQLFKRDLKVQGCYHSVSHHLYYTSSLYYLEHGEWKSSFVCLSYSLRHGVFLSDFKKMLRSLIQLIKNQKNKSYKK